MKSKSTLLFFQTQHFSVVQGSAESRFGQGFGMQSTSTPSYTFMPNCWNCRMQQVESPNPFDYCCQRFPQNIDDLYDLD